jgi:hypothetical protein
MSAPARLTLAPTSDLFVLGTGAAIERRSREEGENKVQTHILLDRQTCCLSGLLLRISAIGRSILLTKPTAAPAAPAACGFERKREISRLYIHKIRKSHHNFSHSYCHHFQPFSTHLLYFLNFFIFLLNAFIWHRPPVPDADFFRHGGYDSFQFLLPIKKSPHSSWSKTFLITDMLQQSGPTAFFSLIKLNGISHACAVSRSNHSVMGPRQVEGHE